MRAARPDIALSGDFIVGFPGETDADFEATLQIVDAVATPRLTRSNIARGRARRPRQWRIRSPRDIMDERLQRLQALINEQQLAFNRATVGRATRRS